MSYSKDFPVSWDEIHRNSKLLAWRLLENGAPEGGAWKGIAAVTRGGLVPACIIAREMDIRLIETVCVASYAHQDQGTAKVLKPLDALGDGAGWIVVDDLVDTGNTFRLIRQTLPRAQYVAVYAKPQGIPTCDTWITEVSQDTWIYFPWDLEMQFRSPLADLHKKDMGPR
ncbi:MAG: xanthine phosphoribosyltransferase [Rhodospirillales bacterium]|nr:xanthine phosphoribosyltransferase [Alphaproteobacteria bacterium]MCB9986399.1 xanthine phosphoribosyltransferase [Rhodospirillales bacterium]USO07053.1 MAG: xanthine phosphoribosyltransferase [Rhodospirillales bacterium]